MKIYTDTKAIALEEKNMQIAVEHLNQFKEEIGDFLGELTPEELKELPANAKAVINANLKARFDFPNASDQFNLDALGLNPSNVLQSLKDNANLWRRYSFEYTDNQYSIINPEKYLKKHTKYATTDEQKEVTKHFLNAMNSFNALTDLGVTTSVGDFTKAFPFAFKQVHVSPRWLPFVMVNNEMFATHLQRLETNRRIPQQTSVDVFSKLDYEPIKQIEK